MTIQRGHMMLHDAFRPPLTQGRYVVTVTTTAGVINPALPSDTRHLDVVGPRFGLSPADVAGCYPPRDAKGPFMEALPHISLGRRTLPWEIVLDPKGRLPAPPPRLVNEPDPPTCADTPPWMALLLLEESEIVSVTPNRALKDVLPASVLADLGANGDTKVTSLTLDPAVLHDIIPTVEEMVLLTHVREVNVDDRELSAGDADGFFAVVMANRVPVTGRKYRACLVSLEGRHDVLRTDYPGVETKKVRVPRVPTEAIVVPELVTHSAPGPVEVDIIPNISMVDGLDAPEPTMLMAGRRPAIDDRVDAVPARPETPLADVEVRDPSLLAVNLADLAPAAAAALPARDVAWAAPAEGAGAAWLPGWIVRMPVELVLLTSWTFACEGVGTFEALCGKLDSRMFGETTTPFPIVADTGHIALQSRDRAGSAQRAWYRGPLAPFPLTRSHLGPAHTADECRTVDVETGMENLTYAAAFEVGRLLAASDARLAQELMRWRRTDYRRCVESSVFADLAARLPGLTDRPELLLAGLAAGLVKHFAKLDLPRVDTLQLASLEGAAGLRAEALAAAWNLQVEEAVAMIAGGPEALGGHIRGGPTGAGLVTLQEVAADAAALRQLASTRNVTATFQAGALAPRRLGGR